MTIYCQKDVILSKRPRKSHEGGGVGIKKEGSKGMGGGGGGGLLAILFGDKFAILFGDKFLKFGQNLTY